MDKSCQTCSHAGTPTYKSPCSECVASGTFSAWESRTCQNCAHRLLTADVEPCKTCFRDRSFPTTYTMWKAEPAYTELETKDEPTDEQKPESNPIRPAHYMECSLECIDVMLAVFGRKAVTDFCIINAFKYMWRYEHKNGLEDLQKAERYLAMATDFSDGRHRTRNQNHLHAGRA